MRSSLRGVAAAAAAIWTMAVAAAPGRAQQDRCPDDDRLAMVEVTVDREAETITVSPTRVEVFLDEEAGRPNRVCWNISGVPSGHTLRFFDKGSSTNLFPGLARTVRARRRSVDSGSPSQAGTWTYGVRVVNPSGGVVAQVDPEVIVKGSG